MTVQEEVKEKKGFNLFMPLLGYGEYITIKNILSDKYLRSRNPQLSQPDIESIKFDTVLLALPSFNISEDRKVNIANLIIDRNINLPEFENIAFYKQHVKNMYQDVLLCGYIKRDKEPLSFADGKEKVKRYLLNLK